jgi:hypothetical protein
MKEKTPATREKRKAKLRRDFYTLLRSGDRKIIDLLNQSLSLMQKYAKRKREVQGH